MHNDSEAPESWMTRALQLKAKHGNGNGAGMPLAVAAKLAAWPTPTSRDWKDGACQSADVESNAPEERVALEGTTAGALNPAWVESLMGFPAGWTITDGPQAAAKRSTNGKPLASRKASRNGGTG